METVVAFRFLTGTIVALVTALGASSARTQWRYQFESDDMTGKRIDFAIVESTKSLKLGFPYQGENRGRLGVRQSPRHGTDVYLEIDKGQFVCGVSECAVLVRFDEQQPVRFTAVRPADHSSTMLFLSPAQRFIASAKKASTIRAQANIFQEGAPILEFNATALEWPPKWTKDAPKATKK